MRVGEIIAEPLQIHTDMSREQQRERVAEVLELVGMRPELARLFPHEFSGGQRQRHRDRPRPGHQHPPHRARRAGLGLGVSIRARS